MMRKLLLFTFSIIAAINTVNAAEILKMASGSSKTFAFTIRAVRYSDVNIEYKIDYGDGNVVDENWSLSGSTAYSFSGSVKGDTIRVYADANISVKDLDISDNDLNSLYMISGSVFAQLEDFDCSGNSLDTLDLSGFTKLYEVNCRSNKIKSLDISNNKSLYDLDFKNNKVESFVSNSAMKYLDCSINSLSSLDISSSTSLKELDCAENKLTTLDITNNTSLITLECDDNQLTSLTLNSSLEEVNCRSNYLSSLDISSCTSLQTLDCSINNLTSITLSSTIQELTCWENQLTSIDLSNCTALKNLYLIDNHLTSIDLSKCSALEEVDLSLNYLTSIDLTNNPNLITAFLSENQISTVKYAIATDDSYYDFALNNLTFSSFEGLEVNDHIGYQYQDEIVIDSVISLDESVDLSSESEVNGTETVFSWLIDSANVLEEGVDYSIMNGVTTFLKVPEKDVYCELTNADFPDLTLQTNAITVTEGSTSAITNDLVSDFKAYSSGKVIIVESLTEGQVAICNLSGQIINEQTMFSKTIQIPVSETGIYIVSFIENGQVHSQKVLVN